MGENVQCPVCTLFLHAGMNLSDHLETHPKEQVIKALVKMTISGGGLADTSALANLLNGATNPKQEDTRSSGKIDESNESNSSVSVASEHSNSTQNSNKTSSDKSLPSKYEDSSDKSLEFSSIVNPLINKTSSSTPNPHIYPQRFISSENSTQATTGTSNSSTTEFRSESSVFPKDFSASNFLNGNHAVSHQTSPQRQTTTNESISQQPPHLEQMQQPIHGNQMLKAPNNFNSPIKHHQEQRHQHQHLMNSSMASHSNLSMPQGVAGQQIPSNEPNFARLPIPPLPQTQTNSNVPGMTNNFGFSQLHPHNIGMSHQRQQHLLPHQQDLNAIYSPTLPPPPPLQLFPFQNQQQHQRPPPAYGTAINQIRSQHYHNRHFASTNNTTIPQAHMPAQHSQIQHQLPPQSHSQEIHSQHGSLAVPSSNGLYRSIGKSINNALSSTPSHSPGKTNEMLSPHNSRSSRANVNNTKNKGSTLENYLLYHQQPQQYMQQQHLPVHRTHHQQHPKYPTMHPDQSQIAPQDVTENLNMQMCSASSSLATQNHIQKQNMSAEQEFSNRTTPNQNMNIARQRAATPAASSVLCFAEPPVAHYLERENGDFIVQETPKHIVECVEKENGEFSVIERIYQSPPSVLHIHDDDEDDEEETNNEPENDSSQSETNMIETKNEKGNITDEDEFMSVTSDSDNEYNNRSKSVRTKRQRRKSSSHKLNEPLNLEPSTSSFANGRLNQNQSDTAKAGPHSQRKKKNTVTVLSDVQLNPHEYLDLVENIIATRNSHVLKLSAIAPLPLVKVEKEEPLDDYEIKCSTAKEQENDNTSNISNIETENLVKVDKAEETIDDNKENPTVKDQKDSDEHCNGLLDESSNSSINSLKNSTSVIRMASTNNSELEFQSEQEDLSIDASPSKANIDENIAEDLSKPQMKTEKESPVNEEIQNNNPPINLNESQQHQHPEVENQTLSTAAVRSSSSLFIKKGPKKLIIKPKSTAKTDNNAKNFSISSVSDVASTCSSSSNNLEKDHLYHDDDGELPSSSSRALKQFEDNTSEIPDIHLESDNSEFPSTPNVTIKSEPNSAIENLNSSRSILDEQLNLSSSNSLAPINCKEEKPFKQEQSFDLLSKQPSTLTKLSTNNDSIDNSETLKDSDETKEIFSMTDNSSSASSASVSSSSSASVILPTICEADKKIVASARYALPNSAINSENSDTILNSTSQGSNSTQNLLLDSSCSSPSLDVASNKSIPIKTEEKREVKHSQESGLLRAENLTQTNPTSTNPLSSLQNTFSEYPFNFLYNSPSLNNATQMQTNINHQQPNRFSPFYQNANEATNAATLASSSASNTASTTRNQMTEPTTVPVALHASFCNNLITSANNGNNSSWLAHHQGNTNFQQNHSNGLQNQHPAHMLNNQQQQNPMQQMSSQQGMTSHVNSDFNAALASVDCNAAVDSGDLGRYLDLDACKREINHGLHTNSTCSSFTGTGGDSNLASGYSADALNIRTDEKMPAKGEISEQESNCDIDNSWSQPMFDNLTARYFRTPFGIFPHDNGCWGQNEFLDVQDLSATAANDSANNRPNKSFDFRFSQEAGTSANLLGNNTGQRNLSLFSPHNDMMPSTSNTTNNKKKKKRDNNSQPTSTVTSQQLMMQQQHLLQQGQFQHPNHTSIQFSQFQHPTSSSSLVAGPINMSDENIPNANNQGSQTKTRKKAYQCPHCNLVCAKLKDRNNHLITMHNYIRQNRRLVCLDALARQSTNALTQPLELIEDSKEGLVKMEMDNCEPNVNLSLDDPLTHEEEFAIITKEEPTINEKDSLTIPPLKRGNVGSSSEVDTKPNVSTLAGANASTKLAAIYKMLVSYNAAVLKENSNFADFDHSLIESSIFYCYVCRTNFTSVKLYDAHLTEHAAECFTCGKKFQRWKNFSLHLKRHMGWKEFACNICDKRFVVRNALVEHLRMHTGQTPLKCKICGKHFKRYSNLTQHRKRHIKHITRKKEYICHCGEVLPSKARYRWHKETHDQKPKCCPHCSDRFVHTNSLRRHIRLAHSDKFDYNEPIKCQLCRQVFAKTSIKAHMATHSNDTQYSCSICNKTFSTKWNLKIHSWVHANRTAKPFKCEHCPKAFVRELDFKNHMNAHKQIKPYTCEYCGCKFIRKYNYMRHRREHHGKKRFTCDSCDKSFHRHYYLIEHRRIHTGERPYQCTICGKSSTTKTNHNKHLKIHHSRDPFTVET